MAAYTLRFLRAFTPNADPAVLALLLRARAENAWRVLDNPLPGRRHVASDRLTIADISGCGCLFSPDGIGVDWAPHRAIGGRLARVSSAPRRAHAYTPMPGHPRPAAA